MTQAPDDLDARLRRLRLRSWRRGTKEMDLILGPWADAHLAGLTPEALDGYEAMLEENDQDLYVWVTGQDAAPAAHAALLAEIGAHARDRFRPR
ncbi:succinate dehydrogenase assembly factor 2 [Rhodobaculum claviforme]|uniref:FAD assembly factor SdhE n=1 Tax=Rhodobaculum claviforme TaxID=1549854 RepID=A0A934WJ32_9RHOB|nr:succinate dehydrogenase assembly factor 2 [Rhodobaculum claviforme]MBK5927601.1 succinate dehydrogenase assembly factor 2 [Rhodobaculum claviforme]